MRKNNIVEVENAKRKTAYEPQAPDVDKMASPAWLKAGELFLQTTGFMIAMQDQGINTNYYYKYSLKDPTLLHVSAKNAERNQKQFNT